MTDYNATTETTPTVEEATSALVAALKAIREGYQQMFDVMPVAWQTFDSIAEQAIADAKACGIV